MRFFLAAVAIVLMAVTRTAVPAVAQDHIQQYGEKDKEKTPSQIEADKEAERAYKRSLGNIPNQGPGDPWGAVRANDAPKTKASTPATKTAKSKAKTGAASN